MLMMIASLSSFAMVEFWPAEGVQNSGILASRVGFGGGLLMTSEVGPARRHHQNSGTQFPRRHQNSGTQFLR